MFTLNENYETDRKILECDYKTYSSADTSLINTLNFQLYINIPRKYSLVFLFKNFLDSNSEFFVKSYL